MGKSFNWRSLVILLRAFPLQSCRSFFYQKEKAFAVMVLPAIVLQLDLAKRFSAKNYFSHFSIIPLSIIPPSHRTFLYQKEKAFCCNGFASNRLAVGFSKTIFGNTIFPHLNHPALNYPTILPLFFFFKKKSFRC